MEWGSSQKVVNEGWFKTIWDVRELLRDFGRILLDHLGPDDIYDHNIYLATWLLWQVTSIINDYW